MELKISEKEMRRLAEEYMLNMYKTGTDPVNYKILQMLPSTTDKIRAGINRSKMPTNCRLHQLCKYGLASWRKGTAIVEKGELTDKFLENIGRLLSDVEKDVMGNLKKNLVEYLLHD